MGKPKLFVGVGTEVVLQALLPVCREVMQRREGAWPEDVHVLCADSDRRSQHRYKEGDYPQDAVVYVQLSLQQVREAVERRREEFSDIWVPELAALLKTAPDNGACMVPMLGRLMLRAVRPTLMRQLTTLRRDFLAANQEVPDVFVVMNPLSGTSRGSVYDLPAYLRHVWPEAMITVLLIYPIGVERIDAHSAAIYQTNFVEALRIVEAATTPQAFKVFADPKQGWVSHAAMPLINNVLVFDARYGNRRLTEFDPLELSLPGGLPELFRHVVSLLTGLALRDPFADWLLGRLSDVTVHRSQAVVAGMRTTCHAVHDLRLHFDSERFQRALFERALMRVLEPLRKGRVGGGDESGFLAED